MKNQLEELEPLDPSTLAGRLLCIDYFARTTPLDANDSRLLLEATDWDLELAREVVNTCASSTLSTGQVANLITQAKHDAEKKKRKEAERLVEEVSRKTGRTPEEVVHLLAAIKRAPNPGAKASLIAKLHSKKKTTVRAKSKGGRRTSKHVRRKLILPGES